MDKVVCGIAGTARLGCHPMEDCTGETYRADMKYQDGPADYLICLTVPTFCTN
jgi:hypothetical protein